MSIIKLQNAGESVTWQVKDAEVVAGNYGQQVKFTDAATNDILYVSKDSVDRQLKRIHEDMTVADCVGATLVISRDPNPKPGAAPYWGIRVADAVDRSQAGEPKRVSSPYQGKYVPGIDGPEAPPDIPEDVGYGVDPHEHFPTHQAGTPVPQAPKVAPKASEKMAVARAYLDLFKWVKTQPEMANVADEAVQAASATIWIAWKQGGLV